MATILTKKKDTSGAPSAGDLTNDTGGAELAVNTADKRLYTKDSGGNVVEVGTNPSTINIDAGSIDGTPIGANSASTGSFTTLNTSGAVVFNDAGADVDFRVEGDTNANLLFVDASADAVGIRTSSPASDAGLTVGGASGNSRIVVRRTNASVSAGNNFLELQAQNSSLDVVGTLAFRRDTADDDAYCAISTRPTGGAVTERMRITSSGNVGIGVTPSAWRSTSRALQFGSGGFVEGRTDNVAVAEVGANGYLDSAGTWKYLGTGTASLYTQAGGHFWYNAPSGTAGNAISWTERMRINSSGNLLVGTTSEVLTSSNRMEVVGTNGIGIKSTGSAGNSPLLAWNSASSGDNYFVAFYTEASVTQRGQIDYNRVAGLVRYGTTSDATLKNIIGDSDGQKSLEILNTTRIREFAWKDDETQKPQIGVIAQELYETYKGAVSVGGNYEEIVPAVTEQRLVSEAVLDEDGNEIEAAVYETVEVEPERTETKYRPWGVDKTAFTFHLVAGWQAHEKIIKQQAEMIAALEARIAALESGA